MTVRTPILPTLATVFTLFANPVNAEELHWTTYGLRPLGMGNAYVAVADDYNALFYNPAGIARLKEWDGEFLNPRFQFAENTFDLIDDLTALSGEGDSSTAEMLELFEKNSGKVHHFGLSLTPHLIFPGFGFALAIEVPYTMAVHSTIDIEVDTGPRLTMPFTYATNFLEDRLSVGFTIKALARGGIDQSLNIETFSALADTSEDEEGAEKTEVSDLFEAGYGVGADVGILFTPIKPMAPTLGISISDLGGTPYEKGNFGGKPVNAPATRLPAVNTGISFKPMNTQGSYVLVSADAHAINQPIHYSHKFNLGVEWGLGEILKVQSGLKAGYLTAGLQFDVGLLNLRLATWVVDHGPVVGIDDDLAERRFGLQLKLLI